MSGIGTVSSTSFYFNNSNTENVRVKLDDKEIQILANAEIAADLANSNRDRLGNLTNKILNRLGFFHFKSKNSEPNENAYEYGVQYLDKEKYFEKKPDLKQMIPEHYSCLEILKMNESLGICAIKSPILFIDISATNSRGQIYYIGGKSGKILPFRNCMLAKYHQTLSR